MKLTAVFEKWPPNTVATSKWLMQVGLSRQLLHVYVKSKWLIKLSNGCYKKPGEEIDWTGAVYALQRQLNLPIYPSGYTALDLHGIRHHLSVQKRKLIFLSGEPTIILPRWLLRTDFGSEISYKTAHLFQKKPSYLEKEFRGNYSIKVPSIEQAVFEILNEVNDASSFEDAANIMSGLLNLNTDNIRKLFSLCLSFKVKRLFVYLAKYYSLPVLNELNYKNKDLGKGILQIVQDGKFDPEFKITVPNQFKQEKENPF